MEEMLVHILIYEVLTQRAVLDGPVSHGLFFNGPHAITAAKKIAREHGWPLVSGAERKWTKTWGECDDYGLLCGVMIVERRVEG